MGGEANVWNPRTLIEVSGDTKSVEERLVAATSQALFILSDFTYVVGTGALEVHKNGALLAKGTEWNEQTSSTFSITTPCTAGDVVVAIGATAITGDVDVRDTDIFLDNYQNLRDYVGTEDTIYVKGQATKGDAGESFFQQFTGASAGTFVDDNNQVIVPSGGNGSVGWLRSIGKAFNSVAALLTSRLESGTQISANKYYSGGALVPRLNYIVQTAAEYVATPDEVVDHTIDNGNIIVLQHTGEIDARQAGSVCDGVTDDSTAFLAALTYLDARGGGTLTVDNDCKIEVQATVSNVTIKGKGKLIGGTARALQLTGDNNRTRGITVEDTNRNSATLEFIGDSNMAVHTTCFNAAKETLDQTFVGDLIRMSGNNNLVFRGEYFNGRKGIKIDGGVTPSARVTGNKVIGAIVRDNWMGINVKPENEFYEIASCVIKDQDVNEQPGADGILIERNSLRGVIHHNVITGSGEHGIYFQGGFGKIHANFTKNNSKSGIKIGGKKTNNFLDAEYPTDASFVCEDTKVFDNHSYDNQIVSTSNANIYIQENHKNLEIYGNTCSGGNYGIRSVTQELGEEMENLKLHNNAAVNHAITDIIIGANSFTSVSDRCGTFTTSMGASAETITTGTIRELKCATLTTADIDEMFLLDCKVSTDWVQSSSSNATIIGGEITINADTTMQDILVWDDCKITLSSDIELNGQGVVADIPTKSFARNAVTAASNTGPVWAVESGRGGSDIDFSGTFYTLPTSIRAMVLYGDAHNLNGVRSTALTAIDIVQVQGDSVNVVGCYSTLSNTSRVSLAAASTNCFVSACNATVIDSGTGNFRSGNRSEP